MQLEEHASACLCMSPAAAQEPRWRSMRRVTQHTSPPQQQGKMQRFDWLLLQAVLSSMSEGPTQAGMVRLGGGAAEQRRAWLTTPNWARNQDASSSRRSTPSARICARAKMGAEPHQTLACTVPIAGSPLPQGDEDSSLVGRSGKAALLQARSCRVHPTGLLGDNVCIPSWSGVGQGLTGVHAILLPSLAHMGGSKSVRCWQQQNPRDAAAAAQPLPVQHAEQCQRD